MFRVGRFGMSAALGLTVAAGLIGCGGDPVRDQVPSTAMEAGTGTGRFSQHAPYDATVYVKDQNTGKLVYMGQVRRDDEIIVDPRRDQVMVAGNSVPAKSLMTSDEYRVYFDRIKR